jgi:predicted alpha/beta hydrolase
MNTAQILTPQTITPEQTIIPAADGYALAASVYAPSEPLRHVIILNSGTGVKRGYYHKFASFLASQGFTVVTYDYRGIGESLRTHIRDFDTSITEWGEKDGVAALNWARERFPNSTISIIGHSAGGKIPGFAPNNNLAANIVTIAVPNSYWGLWHWWGRRGYFVFIQFIMPALSHLLNYFPSRRFGLGENYPKGVALQWSRWSRRKSYILHPTRGHHPNFFNQFRGRVLAISFADDLVATGAAAESLMNFYTAAESRTHWHITPKEHGINHIGHSGFFREACEPLWNNLAKWLVKST